MQSGLIAVGETEFGGAVGVFAAAEPDAPAAQIPANTPRLDRGVITGDPGSSCSGAALLLSIPTGRGREVDDRLLGPSHPATSRWSAAAAGTAGRIDRKDRLRACRGGVRSGDRNGDPSSNDVGVGRRPGGLDG
jgi:hypothetical protein